MKKFLLSFLFIGIAFYCNAQIYLNPGVDTSGTDVQKALVFFNEYIADFKGAEIPDLSKYWTSDELTQRTIPDQLIYAINDRPLYSQGYKATIIYIKPVGAYVHFKTLFSGIMDFGNIMTMAITNHYVALNGKSRPTFINPITINLNSWRSKKNRNITFLYSSEHKFNGRKADTLIQSIKKLEQAWNLKPINIRYYLASNFDVLQKLRGFDFALPMGNRDKPSGISDSRDDQVFCGGLGENYFHEVVHVYLNRLNPKSPIREGLAVFYGGSLGRKLEWHLKRVDTYLEQHKEADLNNIQDFWYPDPYTNAGNAIQGLVCQIVYERDGTQGLKRLLTRNSWKEIFDLELHVEEGKWNSYLRNLIKERSQS